ncbi:rhodanese-like domain-containing protein [Candidatus Nitrotoga sp. M5]|uniref:rhodanese-like domain-containing protein n=1 Tax=Candidatus Nitrotoga sp. M5 TaxID=2890409 RepID=UPI001EF3A625|nr:rhodanese-like domain-containing protein [Candidatus Nitrotoga sp. M5]CAH1386746.1 Rhodanese-related sulfurtransferase [Candidatus Nitrotoga sp. M5]
MNEEKTLMDFVKQAKSQITEIDVSNVKSLLDEGYSVLDVREPAEFMSGTIEGALNIPRGILEVAADRQNAGRNENLTDRNKKWLLLCASSGRSAMATAVMQQMGFKNIKNINGGITAWKAAGLAVKAPSQT